MQALPQAIGVGCVGPRRAGRALSARQLAAYSPHVETCGRVTELSSRKPQGSPVTPTQHQVHVTPPMKTAGHLAVPRDPMAQWPSRNAPALGQGGSGGMPGLLAPGPGPVVSASAWAHACHHTPPSPCLDTGGPGSRVEVQAAEFVPGLQPFAICVSPGAGNTRTGVLRAGRMGFWPGPVWAIWGSYLARTWGNTPSPPGTLPVCMQAVQGCAGGTPAEGGTAPGQETDNERGHLSV